MNNYFVSLSSSTSSPSSSKKSTTPTATTKSTNNGPTYETITDPRGWMTLKLPSIPTYTYLRSIPPSYIPFVTEPTNVTVGDQPSKPPSSSSSFDVYSSSGSSRKRPRPVADDASSFAPSVPVSVNDSFPPPTSSFFPSTVLSDNELVQFIEYMFRASNSTVRNELLVSLSTMMDNPMETLCQILGSKETITLPSPGTSTTTSTRTRSFDRTTTSASTSTGTINENKRTNVSSLLVPYVTMKDTKRTKNSPFSETEVKLYHLLYRLAIIQHNGCNPSFVSLYSTTASVPYNFGKGIPLVSLLELSLLIRSIETVISNIERGKDKEDDGILMTNLSLLQSGVFTLQSYASITNLTPSVRTEPWNVSLSSSSSFPRNRNSLYSSSSSSSSSDRYAHQYTLYHQRLCTSLFMLLTVMTWIKYTRDSRKNSSDTTTTTATTASSSTTFVPTTTPYLHDIFTNEPSLYFLYTECQGIMDNILLPIYTDSLQATTTTLPSSVSSGPSSNPVSVVTPYPSRTNSATASSGETPFPLYSVGDTYDDENTGTERVAVSLISNDSARPIPSSSSSSSGTRINNAENVTMISSSSSLASSVPPLLPFHLPVVPKSVLDSIESLIPSVATTESNGKITETLAPYLSWIVTLLHQRLKMEEETKKDPAEYAPTLIADLLASSSFVSFPCTAVNGNSSKNTSSSSVPSSAATVEIEIPEAIAVIHHWSKTLLQQLLDRLITLLYVRKAMGASSKEREGEKRQEWVEEWSRVLNGNEKSVYRMYARDAQKNLTQWHEYLVQLYG